MLGMLKDDAKTLRDLGIKVCLLSLPVFFFFRFAFLLKQQDGTKIMLVGSSIGDVMNAASAPPPAEVQKAEGIFFIFLFVFLLRPSEQSTESMSEKLVLISLYILIDVASQENN